MTTKPTAASSPLVQGETAEPKGRWLPGALNVPSNAARAARAKLDETAYIRCPTCAGNGRDDHPFDANCPAAWAHKFIYGQPASASPVAAEGADSELEAAMESMEAEARKDEQIGYPSDKPSLLLREARQKLRDLFSQQQREDKENRLRIGTYVRGLEEEVARLKDEELTRNEVELMLAFCHTVKNPDPAVTMLYKKLRRISSPVPPEKK